jgi:hypothetical protein
VPFRPDWTAHQPDPRFDEYRDRVARVFRGQDRVGALFVSIEPTATVLGGQLWWRRWSPTRDSLWIWILLDGDYTDDFVRDDRIEMQLADFDAGRFLVRGEELLLSWLSKEDSVRAKDEIFG